MMPLHDSCSTSCRLRVKQSISASVTTSADDSTSSCFALSSSFCHCAQADENAAKASNFIQKIKDALPFGTMPLFDVSANKQTGSVSPEA